MRYHNYTVTIGLRKETRYPFRATTELAGEIDADLSVPGDEMARRMAAAVANRRDPRELRQAGGNLFGFLFPPPALDHFRAAWQKAERAGDGLRLRLDIEDADLAAWPWELLHDSSRGHTFALSSATLLVRYVPAVVPPPALPADAPLNCLLVLPRAPDLDLAGERRNLADVAAALSDSLTLRILEGIVTRADLVDALLTGDYEILHFGGHGAWAGGEGHLALNRPDGDEDWLDEEALARLIAGFRSLRLVVLNACDTGQNTDGRGFKGVAPRLARAGAPAVVAMQHPIGDAAARTFAREFYKRLLAGEDAGRVDLAIAHARSMLSVLHADGSWAAPALYTSAEDGVIAKVNGEAAAFDPLNRSAKRDALAGSLAASRECEEDWVLANPAELPDWQAGLHRAAAAYRERLASPRREEREIAAAGLQYIESRLESLERALAASPDAERAGG